MSGSTTSPSWIDFSTNLATGVLSTLEAGLEKSPYTVLVLKGIDFAQGFAAEGFTAAQTQQYVTSVVAFTGGLIASSATGGYLKTAAAAGGIAARLPIAARVFAAAAASVVVGYGVKLLYGYIAQNAPQWAAATGTTNFLGSVGEYLTAEENSLSQSLTSFVTTVGNSTTADYTQAIQNLVTQVSDGFTNDMSAFFNAIGLPTTVAPDPELPSVDSWIAQAITTLGSTTAIANTTQQQIDNYINLDATSAPTDFAALLQAGEAETSDVTMLLANGDTFQPTGPVAFTITSSDGGDTITDTSDSSGQPASQNIADTNGNSIITNFGTEDTTSTVYSDPNATGSVITIDQEDPVGSTITTYTPGGSSDAISYDDPDGTGAAASSTISIANGDSITAAVNTPNETATFSGSGTLGIADPIYFTGTISNFVQGDTIDLAGVGASAGATYSNSVLTVQTAGNPVELYFDPNQNFTGMAFTGASDGNGGTDITLTPNSAGDISGTTGDITFTYKGNPLNWYPDAGEDGPGPPVAVSGITGSATFDTPFDYTGSGYAASFVLSDLGVVVTGGGDELLAYIVNGQITQWRVGVAVMPGVGIITQDQQGNALDRVNGFSPGAPVDFAVNSESPGIWTESSWTLSPPGAVSCFSVGTRIAALCGEIPVEELAIGDVVQTQDAGLASIKWIGHRRVDCCQHPKPQKVWPVRVRAGAFGDGMPHHDLWLSPDHAVFVDDVLIPIKRLINSISIEQVPLDEVTYYHVELEHHDVLMAEGLPAESYLDTGDRSNFGNGGGPITLHPEFSARKWDTAHMWEALGCARLVVTGPELDEVRQRVNSRAAIVVAAALYGQPEACAAHAA
jgi:hypothetical protein